MQVFQVSKVNVCSKSVGFLFDFPIITIHVILFAVFGHKCYDAVSQCAVVLETIIISFIISIVIIIVVGRALGRLAMCCSIVFC